MINQVENEMIHVKYLHQMKNYQLYKYGNEDGDDYYNNDNDDHIVFYSQAIQRGSIFQQCDISLSCLKKNLK